MTKEVLFERFFEAVVNGDRPESVAIVDEAMEDGASAEVVASRLVWPTYEHVEKLFRADQMSAVSHNLATRLLRVIADRLAAQFDRASGVKRTVFAVCGPTDSDELGAQMAVDLLEADGHRVWFAGGGIASDEILEQVQTRRPDVLLLFASAPSDLPEIRRMIDTMHEIGACRGTQIVVGGGVFNRADGLAEEIGADLWATDPMDLLEAINDEPERRATLDQRTVGRKRQRRAA